MKKRRGLLKARRPCSVAVRRSLPPAPNVRTVAESALEAGGPIRSDIEGFGAVMDALQRRQFDLFTLSDDEWRRMSPRQQAELVRHQNRSQQLDHSLGPLYFPSDALKSSIDRAHELYLQMTPAQRKGVVHPKHLDTWLESRRPLSIVASDFDLPKPMPAHLEPPSYRLPDIGPAVTRVSAIHLTVRINLESPLQTVTAGVEALITAIHGPAARRHARASSPRPARSKYDDGDIARMVGWYYQQASGTPLKQLAVESAGPKAQHIEAQQRAIIRQLKWFRRELGLASS